MLTNIGLRTIGAPIAIKQAKSINKIYLSKTLFHNSSVLKKDLELQNEVSNNNQFTQFNSAPVIRRMKLPKLNDTINIDKKTELIDIKENQLKQSNIIQFMKTDDNLIYLQNGDSSSPYRIEHFSKLTESIPSENNWKFTLIKGSNDQYKIYPEGTREIHNTGRYCSNFTIIKGINGDIEQLSTFLVPPYNMIPKHNIVSLNKINGSIKIKGDYSNILDWIFKIYKF